MHESTGDKRPLGYQATAGCQIEARCLGGAALPGHPLFMHPLVLSMSQTCVLKASQARDRSLLYLEPCVPYAKCSAC